MNPLPKLFEGMKVVEFASVLAGPAVGMFFSELGAKVIKVENKTTDGDVTRKWKLPVENKNQNKSAYYHSVNWNKEIVFLNLKEELEKAYDLVREADIVISNFKYGSAEKLGLNYKALQKINPSILLGEINAYGKDNPKPGFDLLLQAETGWLSMTGEKGGKPVKLPVALIDILAAHQLKEGLLLAMLNKYKTGKGARVSVSLYDTSIASLANQASNYLNAKHIPKKLGTEHPNIAPYGDLFVTQDNTYIVFAIGTDKQFSLLFEALGLKHLIELSDYSENAMRVENRIKLHEAMQQIISQLSITELEHKMDENVIPYAQISDLEKLFEDQEAKDLILLQKELDGTISRRVKSSVFEIEVQEY